MNPWTHTGREGGHDEADITPRFLCYLLAAPRNTTDSASLTPNTIKLGDLKIIIITIIIIINKKIQIQNSSKNLTK